MDPLDVRCQIFSSSDDDSSDGGGFTSACNASSTKESSTAGSTSISQRSSVSTSVAGTSQTISDSSSTSQKSSQSTFERSFFSKDNSQLNSGLSRYCSLCSISSTDRPGHRRSLLYSESSDSSRSSGGSDIDEDPQEMRNVAQTLVKEAKEHEMWASDPANSFPGDQLLKAAVKYYEAAIHLQEAAEMTILHAPAEDATKESGASKELPNVQSDRENEETKAHLAKNACIMAKFAKTVDKTTKILEDSRGHSFEKFFGGCLDDRLTSVVVEDPYIINANQVRLFTAFCELLTAKAPNLEMITLVTGQTAQIEKFDRLKASLMQKLVVVKRNSIHVREILFDNGWIVKINHGFDFFKMPFRADQAVRRCKKTTVEVIKLSLK
ncbi:hypothetical protein L596_017751 [Steinernema carpocapsae]|uniref:MITD1 C-terminal phospholipase D-like domain-containing protein n=1 Tax=Steinernema carpocapsae TaxID=34508 RepID=A0A4U5N2J6_STECR|nr:hypothetical protein L596_017751 [Steinernema carpocapsae]